MQHAIEKADVLIEALQWIREFRDKIISSVEDALRWGADGVAVTVKFGHEMEGEFIQAASMVA